MSELNRSNLNLTKGVFTKGLVSCLTSLYVMLTQDPPSPSLNDNLSITVDRLNIPVASKTSGSGRSSNS